MIINFNDFLTNCASNNNPLYKLDIIFDPIKLINFLMINQNILTL